MKNLDDFIKKWKQIFYYLIHILHFHLNPFLLELSYFITFSSLGFLALKATSSNPTLENIDLFVTSVSAVTVSSMSTLEMEALTPTQLVVLTFLMLFGGEVFISILELHLTRAKMNNNHQIIQSQSNYSESGQYSTEDNVNTKRKCIKILVYLASCYLIAVHAVGSASVAVYLSLVPSARKVIERKGISMQIFSIFVVVSTFANCGFVPTNENMMVFGKSSGLLIILIPLILMGNTLYPVCLRLLIWFMEKMTKRVEFRYMLENSRELGYGHLMPGLESVYLGITVLGFVVVQMVVFCLMEWHNFGVSSYYEKIVGCLFQVVNSRHAGESVFDLGSVSSAILVLFVVMMYLPPYTSYLPIDEQPQVADENITKEIRTTIRRRNKGGHYNWDNIVFSQLTYLSIFIILICITERQKMKTDPVNFNVLNIVVEVISAYGNVGFSVGYSCEKQIHYDAGCKDAWIGFAGQWSNEGKFVLIIVMFFGRLKKFNMGGGRAWTLS